MEVLIIGPRRQGAAFAVHAAGCLAGSAERDRLASERGSAAWSVDAPTRAAVAERLRGELAGRPDVAPADRLGELEFMSCCASLAPEASGESGPPGLPGEDSLRIRASRRCGACGGAGTVYDPTGFGWEELSRLDAERYEEALLARGRSLLDRLPPEVGPCEQCEGTGDEELTLTLAELGAALARVAPAPTLRECGCPPPALVRDDGTCSGCGAQVVECAVACAPPA